MTFSTLRGSVVKLFVGILEISIEFKNCFNIVGGQLVDNCTDSVIHMEEDDDDDDDEKNDEEWWMMDDEWWW